MAEWEIAGEGVLDQEVLDLLRPDDYLARTYRLSGQGEPISLFIAYFQSQRLGARPHSPRRCLPGSGWLPHSFRQAVIPAADGMPAFPVNEYTLERGPERILALYWYQNAHRAVSRELWLKAYVLPDLYQYRRSDVALVRVIQPLPSNGSATAFSRVVYSSLAGHFPSPPSR
jgi:EpsI family protein